MFNVPKLERSGHVEVTDSAVLLTFSIHLASRLRIQLFRAILINVALDIHKLCSREKSAVVLDCDFVFVRDMDHMVSLDSAIS
jgi:hypothetical protein